MKTITVAASKHDQRAFSVRKFSNAPEVKYLRKISPDRNELTELAAFLFDNCPPVVAGYYPAFDHSKRIVCYNGRSEADQMRFEGKRNAENIIKCYDLENEPCKIQDWKFDVIRHDQSDTGYWNLQAAKMLGAGVVRITIGSSEWAA
jgi:hypothetical protein